MLGCIQIFILKGISATFQFIKEKILIPLWDSITRNITRIGKQYPDWVDARKKDGCRVGVDYSSGALWLNLTEILESGEKWLKL